MMSPFGPFLVLTFALSQAFRDVYFARVFQGVDFFAVILLAFTISTVIFGALAALRAPADFATMRRHLGAVLAMNVTTAMAWTCYFFALRHLEPAVVNTVHSGMAPLIAIALAALWPQLSRPEPIGAVEYGCYAGIALSLAGLVWVVLSDSSGLRVEMLASALWSLASLAVSGTSITISLLYSKRLHDHGVSAEAVTSVRYLLIIALAASIEAMSGRPSGIAGLGAFSTLAVAATFLIAFPTFALQAGIARTTPLTGQIIRSLGPVAVFALEQFDRRIVYSAATLICIAAYSGFAIAANLMHGWRGKSNRPKGLLRSVET